MADVETYQQADSSGELLSFKDSAEQNVGGEQVMEDGDQDESVTPAGVEDVLTEPLQEAMTDGFPVQPGKPSSFSLATSNQEGFEELSPVKGKNDGKPKSPLALWIANHNIPPQIVRLIYWVELQRSAGVFGGLLLLLLSLRFYPLIVVLTSTTLCLLIVAFLYRVGMTIVKAIQKTSSDHPFKPLLEENLEIPEELMAEWASKARLVINDAIRKMQCLLLVQDTIASLKAMFFCWLVSYIASCINVITLCIIALVLLFTVPKLYEEKQKEVDQLLVIAMEKGCIAFGAIEQKMPQKVKAYLKCGKKD